MQDTKESAYCTGNPVCDALRYLNDASYAVLPEDVAHKLGELQKNFWSGVRWLVDKEIEWIERSIEASDHLREEWRHGARREEAERTAADGI